MKGDDIISNNQTIVIDIVARLKDEVSSNINTLLSVLNTNLSSAQNSVNGLSNAFSSTQISVNSLNNTITTTTQSAASLGTTADSTQASAAGLAG